MRPAQRTPRADAGPDRDDRARRTRDAIARFSRCRASHAARNLFVLQLCLSRQPDFGTFGGGDSSAPSASDGTGAQREFPPPHSP